MTAPLGFQSQRRGEGKLPSHPIENPRAKYHEQAKVVITLRNGKLVDNKVGEPIKDSELNDNETEEIDNWAKIERKKEKELNKILEPKVLNYEDRDVRANGLACMENDIRVKVGFPNPIVKGLGTRKGRVPYK
ncbi:hypothetical protein M9H77_13223 [Catharanthus roseus]|uniref:Uncharacterized protein n=1 Tax=Catharanthus roseus TaxID=4058 RepID=A0ACC0BJI8_CATRO|nr:hypothetical protein M9H77_13223 [Catharanthus roseus]